MGILGSVLLTLLYTPVEKAEMGPVKLTNPTWRVTVDPSSLRVTAAVPGRREPLEISAGLTPKTTISNLKVSPREVQWDLPDQRIAVKMRLIGDTLSVDFTAVSAGEFTWPFLPARASNHAYILPIGEGVYAPAHDRTWSAYLGKAEGLTTTGSLSLPLWGIDAGSHSLTYHLTNPFNNELTFQDADGHLAGRLTHHFTPNWSVKTFGYRISLGPASPIEPARRYRKWLQQTGQFVSMKEKIRQTPDAAKLLGAAHVYLWGDGVSTKMLDTLKQAGFDRLWLGSPGWKELRDNPTAIKQAKDAGYLIGPYDSYDSVHSPDAKPDDTWETAQFDQKLFDTGGIVLASGKKKTGFKNLGYYVNASAARPYVEERVARLMKRFQCNSWFMDCDAYGEFFDDYSPLHPANQRQEMVARLSRMSWIRDTYGVVIGSEGGSAYAAGTIHFAHGMMSQPFGWGDQDLSKKESPYFLGAYYPPEEPAAFFKRVPLKPTYYRFLFNPRFRLPLYQTVFHDSVVTTHHWSSPTLKFAGQEVERSLLEQLYNVPPLYHLNTAEFARHGTWEKAAYRFFSPLHRQLGLSALSSFQWLTSDRMVQRTTFSGGVEIVANFRSKPYGYQGANMPPRSILAVNHPTGKSSIYIPKVVP